MEKRPLTLLMIDDSDACLDLIEAFVTENFPDAKVLKANSGKKGLQLAASEDPDVILLDILMPVMDGFEVCRQLKADNALREIPVVFVTVLIDTAQRIKALDAGAEGFLNKPVDEAELIAQIRAMVKIKSANRQKREEAERLKKMVEEQTAELNQKIEAYKMVQESLKASEEKFSEVFYSNPYMLAITRIDDGKIIEVNDAFCQVAGCSREEAINNSTLELKIWVNPKDRDLLVSALLDGRKVDKWQFPFRKKNGDVITGLISSQLLNIAEEPCVVSYIEDITEQKQIEEELNEINARFFAFTENLPVTMFIKNKEQKVLYVNKEMKRVFGDKGWTGKTVYDIFPHDTAKTLIEADNRSFEKGYGVNLHVLSDKDGVERTWETHVFRIDRRSREPLIGAFSLDITDRIKMEQALLQSEENLRNFFNKSIDFMYVLSNKGEIIAVNKTVTNRLGFKEQELAGQKVEVMHAPQHQQEAQTNMREIVQGKRDDCPIPLQSKTGELIPVETNVFRGVWNGQQCFYGVSRDISKLKLSEEKFSKAFHTSPNIVGLSDIQEGEYVEVNKVFYDKLEYTPEEVFGVKIKNLLRMDDEFRNRTIKKLIENGFVRNEETIIYSKSGKPLNVLLSADIIRIGNRDYNFTTAVDITEIRKAEAELKYYAQLLEIIMNIATRYINLPLSRMDEGLTEALRDVGRFVGADRAYIFNYDLANHTATCAHEWCDDAIEPQIQHFKDKPIDELADYACHREGKILNIPDTRKVKDKKFRSFLQLMGIKSIITIPLMHGKECLGYIGFDAVNSYRNYQDNEKLVFEFFAQVLVNIRLRKQDQDNLVQSNEQFRFIFDHAPVLIDAFDKNGQCVLWNKHCENVFGWTFDELKAHADPLSLFYPEPAIRKAVRLSTTGKPVNQPLTWKPLAKNGEELTTNWINFKLPDGIVINIGFDLTHQVKTEKLLSESAQRYYELFENMSEGFFLCEIIYDDSGNPVDFKHLDVNRAYEQQSGIQSEMIIGKTIKEIFPDIEPFWIQKYGEVGTTGKSSRFEGYNKNTGRFFEVSAFSPSKGLTAAIFTDITEKKRNEMLIMKTNERFSMISEHSSTIYWEVDRDGLYKYLSASVRKVFGYYPDELVGKKTFYELHPEDERAAFKTSVFNTMKAKNEIRDLENRVCRKDGSVIWVNTNGLPVLNEAGELMGYRGSDVDITQKKEHESRIHKNIEEIKAYRNKLKMLNDALIESEEKEKKNIAEFLHDGLGQLLSITHIRLTSLLYENQLPGEVEKIIRESSKTVNDAIVQCREITYELNPPVLKSYGLVEAMKWKLDQVQKQFDKSVSLQPKTEITIKDDKLELLLYRVLCELINNAIKHADCTKITIETDKTGKKQVISVIDDGAGFNYNSEIQPSDTKSFGLFSIRERLEPFRGRISIQSSPGEGTKASIIF